MHRGKDPTGRTPTPIPMAAWVIPPVHFWTGSIFALFTPLSSLQPPTPTSILGKSNPGGENIVWNHIAQILDVLCQYS